MRVRCPQESDGLLTIIATGIASIFDILRQRRNFARPPGWERSDTYEKKVSTIDVEESDIQRYISEGYRIREL